MGEDGWLGTSTDERGAHEEDEELPEDQNHRGDQDGDAAKRPEEAVDVAVPSKCQ